VPNPLTPLQNLKVFTGDSMKLHKKLRKRFEKKEAAKLVYSHTVNGEESLSNSQMKRADMQEEGQWAKRRQQFDRTHDGQPLPSEEDGWYETVPPKPEELSMVGVKKVKMSDGSARTFRKWIIKKDVLEQKRKKAKKLLKRVKRENAEAARKEAKQRVRLIMALMGKV
jgi:hypothetical protein